MQNIFVLRTFKILIIVGIGLSQHACKKNIIKRLNFESKIINIKTGMPFELEINVQETFTITGLYYFKGNPLVPDRVDLLSHDVDINFDGSFTLVVRRLPRHSDLFMAIELGDTYRIIRFKNYDDFIAHIQKGIVIAPFYELDRVVVDGISNVSEIQSVSLGFPFGQGTTIEGENFKDMFGEIQSRLDSIVYVNPETSIPYSVKLLNSDSLIHGELLLNKDHATILL
ncbi:MAG: hypothetical protein MRY83_23090 [Flavobacteriales bacterium]|nr:hypothetical protein [Flavobacteriales bacterium]